MDDSTRLKDTKHKAESKHMLKIASNRDKCLTTPT